MASGLSSVDVEYLSGDKSGAIEIEHRIYDVGHLPHPTHWMKCRQSLMCRLGCLPKVSTLFSAAINFQF